MAKAEIKSKTMGRLTCTPQILDEKKEDAELHRAWQHSTDQPETRHKTAADGSNISSTGCVCEMLGEEDLVITDKERFTFATYHLFSVCLFSHYSILHLLIFFVFSWIFNVIFSKGSASFLLQLKEQPRYGLFFFFFFFTIWTFAGCLREVKTTGGSCSCS